MTSEDYTPRHEPGEFTLMAIAYLGLGSNLGNRLEHLRGGRELLAARYPVTIRRSSPLYETAAVGGPPDSPDFFNAVLEVETDLPPRQLLAAGLAVEAAAGRRRPAGQPWAPRTLDIDLLLYDRLTHADAELQLPHPRLHQRAFVLAPLRDLVPELVPPGFTQNIAQLAALLPSAAALTPLRDSW